MCVGGACLKFCYWYDSRSKKFRDLWSTPAFTLYKQVIFVDVGQKSIRWSFESASLLLYDFEWLVQYIDIWIWVFSVAEWEFNTFVEKFVGIIKRSQYLYIS